MIFLLIDNYLKSGGRQDVKSIAGMGANEGGKFLLRVPLLRPALLPGEAIPV